jgi:acyl-CoA synthetase (AMP-forming)/AMP-acid ligase II
VSTPAPGALWARLRGALVARGEAPAFTFLDSGLAPETWSGHALLARVDDLAARIAALRLEGRGPLGIMLATPADQVTHFLAALAAGIPPALLTPPNRKLHPGHFRAMLEGVTRRCAFAAIVSELDLPGAATTLLEPGVRAVRRAHAGPPGPPVEGASFVQFSSGTTGIKRGVCVSDAAVLAQVDRYADALALAADDTIVSWLPLYHDMGFVACFLMPLARGTHAVMLRPLDWVARPALWLRAVHAWRGTLAWHPNFAYAFMAERADPEACADLDLSCLRALVNCSEPVTDASQSRFLARFTPHGLRPGVFRGCYAMAETTFALTDGSCTDPGYRARPPGSDGAVAALSVGRPLPGVAIEVVDEHGAAVPDGVVGQLRVRSPFNFSGYHNNAEATAEAVRDGWYHTGDLGWRAGGELFVSGRRKDLLIAGGVNVWPADLEAVACEEPGVHAGRAAAFSAFDPVEQTERIVLLVESDAPSGVHRALTTGIRQRVLAVFQISNFEVHVVPPGWLVKSSSGKMARSENRERWQGMHTPALRTA